MILYPAIDLLDGACVRLSQGRFEDAKVYPPAPAEALANFAAAGAEWVHVVDLDGARARSPRQHGLIAHLAQANGVRLQVAGGIRTAEQVAYLLDRGVGRVVIGSLAVADPPLVRELFDRFGADRLVLALDVLLIDGRAMVATSGWTETSQRSLEEVAAEYPQAKHMLVTDIDRDGMLSGPNSALIETLAAALPSIAIQASGGVASLEDLERLKASGAAGAIVGKALWEERFTLDEALARAH